MSLNRYARTPILNFGAQYGTGRAREAIQSGIANGQIQIVKTIVVRGRERLDTIAGEVYGDGRLWWVLAAASNIGWGLQIPPGTIINIPALGQVAALIG
jgi:nucleoid-associated protein YgaU